jgi:hypothetical protein
MEIFELHLPEETAERLDQAAARLNLSPEELLVLSVQEKLANLDAEFRRSADYVLEKNADLYERLA